MEAVGLRADAMQCFITFYTGTGAAIPLAHYIIFFWLVFLTFLVEKNLYFSKQITHLDGWMFCQSRRKLSNTLFSDLVLNPVLNPVLNARTLHLIHCLHSVEANRRKLFEILAWVTCDSVRRLRARRQSSLLPAIPRLPSHYP